MIYGSAKEWLEAPERRVLLFGMSGLGKTHVSRMLRSEGGWYHYSIDYRIGTRYVGEDIVDNVKREAMKVPFLRELLMGDSIRIRSKISFQNLAPLSTYLGKPGDPAKGGLPIAEYRRRQAQHEVAEIAALLDTGHFAERAKRIYGYDHFVCDSSGSMCEVVDPENPDDRILKALSSCVLMVWIRGSEAHVDELVRRFDKAPKPMCYQPEFLSAAWENYLAETGCGEESVDPDSFVRWTYSRAVAHRAPRYEAIADRWGVSVDADDLEKADTPDAFVELVARALGGRGA